VEIPWRKDGECFGKIWNLFELCPCFVKIMGEYMSNIGDISSWRASAIIGIELSVFLCFFKKINSIIYL